MHTNNELGRATCDVQEAPDYGEFAGKDWPNPEKGQARFIQLLDDMVGMVVKKLEDLKLDDNTVIMFTSDNGPPCAASSGIFTRAASGLRRPRRGAVAR